MLLDNSAEGFFLPDSIQHVAQGSHDTPKSALTETSPSFWHCRIG